MQAFSKNEINIEGSGGANGYLLQPSPLHLSLCPIATKALPSPLSLGVLPALALELTVTVPRFFLYCSDVSVSGQTFLLHYMKRYINNGEDELLRQTRSRKVFEKRGKLSCV
jgi:hypothetical protein